LLSLFAVAQAAREDISKWQMGGHDDNPQLSSEAVICVTPLKENELNDTQPRMNLNERHT